MVLVWFSAFDKQSNWIYLLQNAVTETGFFETQLSKKSTASNQNLASLEGKQCGRHLEFFKELLAVWVPSTKFLCRLLAWYAMFFFCFFLPLLSCELHASQELERYMFLRVFMLPSIPFSMVAVLMRRSVRKVIFLRIFVSQNRLHGTLSDQGFWYSVFWKSCIHRTALCCPKQPSWKKYDDVAPKQRSCVTLGDIRRLQTWRPHDRK